MIRIHSLLQPSLLLLACILGAACASDRSVGLNQLGLPVYLLDPEASGARIDDAARADAVLDAAAARLEAELPAALEEVLRETAAQARFSPERIALHWTGRGFDSDTVLLGKVGSYSGIDVKKKAASGLDFEGSASAQVMPWPRREGVLPHPELLMVQASISYRANGDAHRLGSLLVERLAERARQIVIACASSAGLRGSTEVPGGNP